MYGDSLVLDTTRKQRNAVRGLAGQLGIAVLFPAVVLTRTEPHRGESHAPSEDRMCWLRVDGLFAPLTNVHRAAKLASFCINKDDCIEVKSLGGN
jgi:hypothetical protein